MKKLSNVIGVIGCVLMVFALALACRAGYLSSKGPEWKLREMRNLWLGVFVGGVGFFCVCVAGILANIEEDERERGKLSDG